MWDTAVTIYRGTDTSALSGLDGKIAQHIRVRVAQVSDQEAIQAKAYDFHADYDHKIITFNWYPNSLIRQGDILVDEQNLDPLTGVAYKYRITDRPKDYVNHHQEMKAKVVLGR